MFCVGQENAVVIHSIVGWKSSIGKWSRVQACLSPLKMLLIYFLFVSLVSCLNLSFENFRGRETIMPSLESPFLVNHFLSALFFSPIQPVESSTRN